MKKQPKTNWREEVLDIVADRQLYEKIMAVLTDKKIISIASSLHAQKARKNDKKKYGKVYSKEMSRRRAIGIKKRRAKLKDEGLAKNG